MNNTPYFTDVSLSTGVLAPAQFLHHRAGHGRDSAFTLPRHHLLIIDCSNAKITQQRKYEMN